MPQPGEFHGSYGWRDLHTLPARCVALNAIIRHSGPWPGQHWKSTLTVVLTHAMADYNGAFCQC